MENVCQLTFKTRGTVPICGGNSGEFLLRPQNYFDSARVSLSVRVRERGSNLEPDPALPELDGGAETTLVTAGPRLLPPYKSMLSAEESSQWEGIRGTAASLSYHKDLKLTDRL